MKSHLLPLLLCLPGLAAGQCASEPEKLICYDYPGAVTQNLEVGDIQTIAWYLRWYSHAEGNPLFWTMYTTENETTTSVPLNDTSLANLTPGGSGAPPAINDAADRNTTSTSNSTVSSSSNTVGNTTAPINNSAPADVNGTAPFLNLTTTQAVLSSINTNTIHTAPMTIRTAVPTVSEPPAAAADQCLEWTVITRGTVMLLARLGGARNASVLYDDIAFSLNGIAGDWGSWTPRARGKDAAAVRQKTPVLLDCNNSGGQIPVYVNKTNAAYHSEEFLRQNYSTDGIWLKLVHAPATVAGEKKRFVGYGESERGHL
ncbi:hypothetical protein BROUX41_006024 [Berkeleyomyces rouxiae]